MLRARLFAATSAIGIAGIVLAGCSSSSVSDWVKPAPPPGQVVQFDSVPQGANVQAGQGQTCRTPCSLTLALTSQSVSLSMDGYITQTIQLNVREPEHSIIFRTSPDLTPNPVILALQAIPPPPPPPEKPKPRKIVARPKPAAPKPVSTTVPAPQDNAFPPPPAMRPALSSPFPPPPTR